MNKVKVGDIVRLGVFVGGKWKPMSLGQIVAIHSGYIEADVMGIHGGKPWIHLSANGHYMLESDYQSLKEKGNE